MGILKEYLGKMRCEENCRLTLAVGSTEESYKICQLGAEVTI